MEEGKEREARSGCSSTSCSPLSAERRRRRHRRCAYPPSLPFTLAHGWNDEGTERDDEGRRKEERPGGGEVEVPKGVRMTINALRAKYHKMDNLNEARVTRKHKLHIEISTSLIKKNNALLLSCPVLA